LRDSYTNLLSLYVWDKSTKIRPQSH
jgi:hypothetical protein